jgi:crotonobetainyl-CoA:carnitine CoA-transferase CaiB-like acyl-CoA transferase
VDIAIADGMLAHAVVPMMSVLREGHTRPAGTDKLSGGLPCYGLYATRDGRHLAVGALERKFWDRFCEVLGREDLKPRHLPADAAERQALRAELTEIIGSQALASWQQRFAGTGCCVTPVQRLDEALDDPHFRARGMVVEPPDGAPRQLACPVKMSGYTFELRRAAPQPGEHSDELLAELGYGASQREALRAQGVIA